MILYNYRYNIIYTHIYIYIYIYTLDGGFSISNLLEANEAKCILSRYFLNDACPNLQGVIYLGNPVN